MTDHTASDPKGQYPNTRDYWQHIYAACRLGEQADAPSVNRFCQDPWPHLEQQGQTGAPASIRAGYEPLLPAQATVARHLAAEEAADTRVNHSAQGDHDKRPDRSPAGRTGLPAYIMALPTPGPQSQH